MIVSKKVAYDTCKRIWVIHQRKPDITAASMTKMKPQKSNSVSFATAKSQQTVESQAYCMIW